MTALHAALCKMILLSWFFLTGLGDTDAEEAGENRELFDWKNYYLHDRGARRHGREDAERFGGGGQGNTLDNYLENLRAILSSLNKSTAAIVSHKEDAEEAQDDGDKELLLSVQASECEALTRYHFDSRVATFAAELGASVNLSCLSKAPHEWVSNAQAFDPDTQLQKYSSLSEMSHLVLTPSLRYPDYHYRSALHLVNVSYLDVGFYSCRSAPRTEESAYLFVEDNANPAAATDSPVEAVSVRLGEKAALPCRPSHPSFTVSLVRDGLDVSGLFEYDPMRGFLIRRVWESHLPGDYSCLFSSAYVFEQRRPLVIALERNWAGGDVNGTNSFSRGLNPSQGGENKTAEVAHADLWLLLIVLPNLSSFSFCTYIIQ